MYDPLYRTKMTNTCKRDEKISCRRNNLNLGAVTRIKSTQEEARLIVHGHIAMTLILIRDLSGSIAVFLELT